MQLGTTGEDQENSFIVIEEIFMKKIIWVALLIVFGTFGWGHAQLPDAPNKVRPLMVGDEVPALRLADANGRDFDLGAHKKPTILIFYRGYW